ncbi:MAG TPA: hypothetical protein VK034_29645 [Enhygromyxa sp.]|nr:hypothetical protein [Enhygromyxa sp.]
MSRGEDKRLRATFVLLGALAVEIYWLKFRVVPDFVRLYAEFGELPRTTELVFGWTPYLIAGSLAPLALILALRGADGHRRSGIAGVVLAAVLVAGLGIGVIGALYRPIYALAGQIE